MKRIVENKDLSLKLMCKTLFKNMRYNTHYEIKLRNKSYIASYKTHDVSDIDVYGYKFNADLSFISIGAECKSGETNALEDFFKFLGIVDYYNIDKGYLIKTKIHQNARQLAADNNFRCFTEAELRKILLGLSVNLDALYKIENGKYYKLNSNLRLYKGKNDKLIDYITLDYWNKENWKNIHNLLHILKSPANTNLFAEKGIAVTEKFIYYYVLELFSLSFLKNLSESMVLNYSDIENAVVNSLYGGAEMLNEKRRLHDLVNQSSKENRAFEPDWQSDFVNLSSRFSQSTFTASKIPQMIQDLYENIFYENKIIINPSLIKQYPDLTRKFVQDLMQFLTKHCSVDKIIFEDFMNL